jgi:transposase
MSLPGSALSSTHFQTGQNTTFSRRRPQTIARVKRKRDTQAVCARVGALLGKYKIEKFFNWFVDEKGQLTFSLDKAVVAAEEALDGCYVIRSDAHARSMNKEQAVAGYMALRHVEKAFRSLKTVALELRPVYHKTDDRIRAHVFLCFLSYYLLWHAEQRLKPLFEQDGTHEQRRWSMPVVIERLKSLRREQLLVKNIPVRHLTNQPDKEQQQILDCLGVK